ncbi:MAG: hypothetical protein GX350_04210 [Erysipelotrichaceae bacterium]|nr:hypothetical protein [Erysipelotrichaceae bacterium]
MSELVYKKIYPVTVNDRDFNNRLTPEAILNFVQDNNERQMVELGLGYDDLLKEGFIALILRTKYEVLTDDLSGLTDIEVITWPQKPGRVEHNRDFLIYNVDGTPLIKGTSLWVVVDYKTRMIQRGNVVSYAVTTFKQANFKEPLNKLKDVPALVNEDKMKHEVKFTDLDENKHLNNTKYARIILDALELSIDENIKTFEIDYVSEVKYGETLKIAYNRDGKHIDIAGYNEGGVSMRARIDLY